MTASLYVAGLDHPAQALVGDKLVDGSLQPDELPDFFAVLDGNAHDDGQREEEVAQDRVEG